MWFPYAPPDVSLIHQIVCCLVVPILRQGRGLPQWPRGKGCDQGIVRWSHKVIRQMRQRQVHDVAVVRMLFVRCLEVTAKPRKLAMDSSLLELVLRGDIM
jgi:hypothetical protein